MRSRKLQNCKSQDSCNEPTIDGLVQIQNNNNNNYINTDFISSSSIVDCNENMNQYLLNTSLHGLRYVGDRTISLCERIFYGFAFLIVFLLSSYFILNVWDKWSASPIIIAFNSIATPINKIPFPAVTICNMNQAKNSMAKKIRANTLDESLLQSLCGKDLELLSNNGTTSAVDHPESMNFIGKWSTFRGFLLKTSQSCNDLLLFCKYNTRIEQCTDIFDTTLTDEGLCCTFNKVHPMYLLRKENLSDDLDDDIPDDNIPIDWTPENGYPYNLTSNGYPRPGPGTGSHRGLSVALNANVKEYHCSSTNSIGFKILLHNPTETPKIKDYGFALAPGMEARVTVTPKISDASNRLRSIRKSVRQCIFADEGNLTYFRTYSRKNCEMECESRYIERECGCILYYMPRTHENSTICKQSDRFCYEKYKLLSESLIYRDTAGNNNRNRLCECLPACFEINYVPQISTSILHNGKFNIEMDTIEHLNVTFLRENIAIVHIYYEENSFRSLTKEELIGFTEFLSNTGGLLGLFMGFSVISLIEIFYFITIRPYCIRIRSKHQQQKEQNHNQQPQQQFKQNNPFDITDYFKSESNYTTMRTQSKQSKLNRLDSEKFHLRLNNNNNNNNNSNKLFKTTNKLPPFEYIE